MNILRLQEKLDALFRLVVDLSKEHVMSILITLPDDLAEALSRTAAAAGQTPEEVAVAAIRKDLYATHKLAEALAPIRQAFVASGLSEDEAVELFEAEKHALRRERTAADK